MQDAAIDQVVEILGCPREAAARAVEAAGPGGVEVAIDLVLSTMSTPGWASSPLEAAAMKMVCLVRADLGMSAGKVAAQVAHGALGAVRATQSLSNGAQRLRQWEENGEAVIVLRVPDASELEDLIRQAKAQGLVTHVVADAGRTEVAPGSETVGTIGPDLLDKVDAITGGLSLLQ